MIHKTANPVHLPHILLIICLSAVLFSSPHVESQATYLQAYCQPNGDNDQASNYQNTLNLLLYNLTSASNTKKFYNFTTGETSNTIYGLYLCNSVYIKEVCKNCITIAAAEIQQRCPSSKEAIVWYTGCMLRYANHSIFTTDNLSIFYNVVNGPATYGQFSQRLSDTFVSLINTAISTPSPLVSAASVTYMTKDVTVTSYVDCTPDLIPTECNRCFQTALGRLQLKGSQAGVILQPNCRLMYEFNDARPLSLGKRQTIALGAVSAVAGISLCLQALLYLKRRKTTGKFTKLDEIESIENLHFEFNSIRDATDNFSIANKLGQGGFGSVYKGILGNGQAVAVKRLSKSSAQGIREFRTEACLAAKLQHINLVKLYGFCLDVEEMLLVYELVPNKSLDRFLFDPKRGANLKWETRYKIINGIAQGLLYLHDHSRPKIVHRDMKPSNILLDGEMNPKIADFGMAKLFGVDQPQGNTSRVAGTFGYMAPEYATTGHFSVKSDIFSYGVIVLEIVSGMRNSFSNPFTHDENLLNYAWRLWNEGDHFRLVDSALGSNFSKSEVERCIHVGLLCTQEDSSTRPNILTASHMLNTRPVTLQSPGSPPPFPYQRQKSGGGSTQEEYLITNLSAR